MYELSFPAGDPDAAGTAAAWVVGIVRTRCPDLASAASLVVHQLVINASRHTSVDKLIEVRASMADGVLRLEVRDPSTSSENREWTTISRTARRFGGSSTEGIGHLGWAELDCENAP